MKHNDTNTEEPSIYIKNQNIDIFELYVYFSEIPFFYFLPSRSN